MWFLGMLPDLFFPECSVCENINCIFIFLISIWFKYSNSIKKYVAQIKSPAQSLPPSIQFFLETAYPDSFCQFLFVGVAKIRGSLAQKEPVLHASFQVVFNFFILFFNLSPTPSLSDEHWFNDFVNITHVAFSTWGHEVPLESKVQNMVKSAQT